MSARKRAARFRVDGYFDGAKSATVTITPEGLFVVRPHRRRRSYAVTLAGVASSVIIRTIRLEVEAKRLAKKAARRARRAR